MLTTLLIAGSVALILFGVRFLRKGLDRFFGGRLALWIQKLGKDRFRGFFAGLSVAICSPSSTTISILSVQAVKEGHLSPRECLAVALGANIGLTTPALLLGFSLDSYAPLLILVGVILFQFTKTSGSRGIGQIILSLGLIFLAVHLIRQYVGDVISHTDPQDDLAKLIRIAENHPLWLCGVAAIITVLLQSSTASIGLIIGLMAGGVDSMAIAYPAVIGTNIGLGLTLLLMSWRQIDARRMALSNLLLKLLVAALMLIFSEPLIAWFESWPGDITQHITYAHLGYNVVVAAVGLPLIRQVNAVSKLLVRGSHQTSVEVFGPRYIRDQPGESPVLALGQSKREIIRVSEIVREMLDDMWLALKTDDELKVRMVAKRDDHVDLLDTQIKRYLTRLSSSLDEVSNSREQINQLTYLSELETIGDIIDKNLSELVLKKIKLRAQFTDAGWKELDDFYQKVAQNLLIADTAFSFNDPVLARQLLRHKDFLSQYERKLRDHHFARLNSDMQLSHSTSAIHLDILASLKRINSGVAHVGHLILGESHRDEEHNAVERRDEARRNEDRKDDERRDDERNDEAHKADDKLESDPPQA